MIVAWHGHACVSLTINSYVVVIDPHDGASIGLKKPDVRGDLILVTHDHFDHNAVNAVSKDRSRVFKMFYGETLIDDIKVTGLRTFHDKQKGRRRGENAVYIVEAKGFRVAHLGDLGEIPSEDVVARLRGVDLLAIPVGGTFTIEPEEAWELVKLVNPINVMPMHYWIPGTTLPLKPVDAFLKLIKGYEIVKLATNKFDLRDFKNKVVVPSPP
ncbi:MAG: MBL fold metallo-hydrolase [Desulfurococcaceae archaeon]